MKFEIYVFIIIIVNRIQRQLNSAVLTYQFDELTAIKRCLEYIKKKTLHLFYRDFSYMSNEPHSGHL